MVLLTTTLQILEAIESLSSSEYSELQETSDSPLPKDVDSPVSHKTLIALAKLCRRKHSHADGERTASNTTTATTTSSSHRSEDDKPLSSLSSSPKVTKSAESNQKWTLNNLLRNTAPYHPPPTPKPQPTPEFTALMTNLRLQEERRQYLKLLSDNERASQRHETEQYAKEAEEEQEEDPITPSLVLNIFLSVILTGGAVFQLSRWWGDVASRVLLSMFAAVVVGVAEVVVYAAYVRNVKRGRRREKLKREKKVVLGRFEHLGHMSDDDGGNGVGNKDESEGGGMMLAKVYDGTGREVYIDSGYRRGEKREKVSGDDGGDLDNDDDDGVGVVQVSADVIWGKGKHGGMRRRVRDKWEKDQRREQEAEAEAEAKASAQ